MTRDFTFLSPREQRAFEQAPYDRWIAPDGREKAAFYRRGTHLVVRFDGVADFEIDKATLAVRCWPAPGTDEDSAQAMFEGCIRPVLGNHRGDLFLHGSSAARDGRAAIFLGTSQSGKTTLVSALTKAGFSFLSEDVIELVPHDSGYAVVPQTPTLNLFADSARYFLGREDQSLADGEKLGITLDDEFAVAREPCPLAAIFLLGPGRAKRAEARALGGKEALARMMPHGFLLDVEDRESVSAHFDRLARLAGALDCFELDYPREYSALPEAIEVIDRQLRESR